MDGSIVNNDKSEASRAIVPAVHKVRDPRLSYRIPETGLSTSKKKKGTIMISPVVEALNPQG